jgi:hypothetical protein
MKANAQRFFYVSLMLPQRSVPTTNTASILTRLLLLDYLNFHNLGGPFSFSLGRGEGCCMPQQSLHYRYPYHLHIIRVFFGWHPKHTSLLHLYYLVNTY